MRFLGNIILASGLAILFIFPAACTHISKPTTEVVLHDWLKPGLLNSDRIKMKFGSFGVTVISQDPQSFRLSSLYSLDKEEKISRTIALTTYEENMNQKLKNAHEEIVNGGSIGSTLSKHGFKLIKDIKFKGHVSDMPAAMKSLMKTSENNYAALIYDLGAEKNGVIYPYSTIAEVYSPYFLTLSELNLIYPEVPKEQTSQNQIKEGLGKKASEEYVQATINKMRILF